MTDRDFVRVMTLKDVPAGQMRSCQVAGRDVVVCHTKMGVFALDNVCTHAYARMSEGRLKGERIICPMHGASFDVRDGRVLGGPAVQSLIAHLTRIVDGAVEVAVDPAAPPQPAP